MKKILCFALAVQMIFSGTFNIVTLADKNDSSKDTTSSATTKDADNPEDKDQKEDKDEKEDKETSLEKVSIKSDFSSTDSIIKISWNKVDNISGYRVFKKSDGKWETVKNVNSRATSFRFKNLSPATTYKFKVQAFRRTDKDTVWGKASNVVKASTKPLKIEPTVSEVTENTVSLRWDSVKCNGYELYQQFDNGETQLISTYDSTINSVKINCPNSGQKYKFKIRAYKNNSSKKKVYSDYSSIEATTKETPKPAQTEKTIYYGTTYILNTSTLCYHEDSNCRAAKRIAPENYATSNSIPAGYSPCGICVK